MSYHWHKNNKRGTKTCMARYCCLIQRQSAGISNITDLLSEVVPLVNTRDKKISASHIYKEKLG